MLKLVSNFTFETLSSFLVLSLLCAQPGNGENLNAPVEPAATHGVVHLQLEKAQADVKQKHYHRAYNNFSKLARKGHAPSQHISGLMNEKGIGTPRNLRKAFSFYQLAAARDFADSQSKLGHMYLHGNEVVRQDFDKAKMWLEKAAHNNNPEAQHSLGLMYAKGQGVKQDAGQAARWLKLAAGNGVKGAEQALEKLPPVKPLGNGIAGGNPLGSAGTAYGTGLQSIKQSWSGYGDIVHSLNNSH